MKQKKSLWEKAPLTGLVITPLVVAFEVAQLVYAYFWIFGSWLPWWVITLYGTYTLIVAFTVFSLRPKDVKRVWTLTVVFWTWLVLGLLHFAPHISWPIVK